MALSGDIHGSSREGAWRARLTLSPHKRTPTRNQQRRAGRVGVLNLVALAAGQLLLLVASARAETRECLMCHSAPTISRTSAGSAQESVHVDESVLAASVHAKQQCTDCHTDIETVPHEPTEQQVRCDRCHDIVGQMGEAGAFGSGETQPPLAHAVTAPACTDCHGTHDIRPASDPESPTYRMNIPALCATCHAEPRFRAAYGPASGRGVKQYRASVHGQGLATDGLVVAAVCTDCHGTHDIRKVTDPRSPAARAHIPNTCAKCHVGIYKAYVRSVHGMASATGIADAPVCTDCHGEHAIRRPTDPESSVYPTHVAQTCGSCHEDETLQARYGLPGNRMATYLGSYHGVASKYGDAKVANCGTCHGAHDVLPSSDPRSAVNPQNIPRTCGRCHPGAGQNFALGTVHLQPSRKRDVGVFAVRVFYTIFIAALGGAFLVHIALDLIAWRRRAGRKRRGG